MSDNDKVTPDPEPDYAEDPESWRRWREREVDRFIASGQKTTFGFWRTYYEDIKHGPSHSYSRPATPETFRPSTPSSPSGVKQQKGKFRLFKKRGYVPIAERGDPKTNIFRIAADNTKRKDSYPASERVKDLVTFGLLPEPALQPYLDLTALYLHMTHFKKQKIVTPDALNQALEAWATHFAIAPETKITLAFEDYMRPEDMKWLKQEAKKDEASVLEWVARCRWATADFFKD